MMSDRYYEIRIFKDAARSGAFIGTRAHAGRNDSTALASAKFIMRTQASEASHWALFDDSGQEVIAVDGAVA